MLSQLDCNRFISLEKRLSHWAQNLITRFPTWFDIHLYRGIYHLLGSAHPVFLKESPLFHLQRLLLTQFFLQKKIKISQQNVLLRIYNSSSHLCIGVVSSISLSNELILDLASILVPSLKIAQRSSYERKIQDGSFVFRYLEIDKMRGSHLTFSEIKAFEKNLIHQLKNLLPHASPTLFLPYNHEESYRQIMLLRKEIHSSHDLAQVSIHFKKHDLKHLEFLICLVRPKTKHTQELSSNLLPSSMHLISYLKKEISTPIACLAEVFSLSVPSKNFHVSGQINLLRARDLIAKLIRHLIGPFRDVNGGLFESQKRRFMQLQKKFQKKNPHFTSFGEALFYSILPFEKQISLSDSLFEMLFKGFSQALTQKTSRTLKRHVLILRFKESSDMLPYLSQAKRLEENKETSAYANLYLFTFHYLCILNESKKIPSNLFLSSFQKPLTLYLTLRGTILSLSPFFLAQERRGRALAKLLFEGLTRLGPQGRLEYAGCQKVTLSQNKRLYLFHLRSNYWSSGEKVTAFHYQNTWEKNANRHRDFNLFLSFSNMKIRVIDEEHLQVELEKEDPYFLDKLAHPLFSPTPHFEGEPRCFNGPYVFCKQDSKQLILERNPYFWDRKNIFFEEVIFRFETSSKRIERWFKEGKTDWLGKPFNYPNFEHSSRPLISKKISRPFFIHFNTKHNLLSSRLIRLALSTVIDRHFITDHILCHYDPLFNLLPQNPSFPLPCLIDNDMTKGKELFDLGLKALGVQSQHVSPLILTCDDVSEHKQLAHYLKKVWEKVFHIHIEIALLECNAFYRAVEQGNFQMIGFFRALPTYYQLPFLKSFVSNQTNRSFGSHPKYSLLFRSLERAISAEQKKTYLQQAEAFLLNEMPLMPLFNLKQVYKHNPLLKQVVINDEGDVDFRFAYLENSQMIHQESLDS